MRDATARPTCPRAGVTGQRVVGERLRGARSHVVVVEAYDGHLEFVTDEQHERAAAAALGLPWAELADLVDCRVTVLAWDEWRACELLPNLPFTWATARPVTRPSPAQVLPPVTPNFASPRVTGGCSRRAILSTVNLCVGGGPDLVLTA